MEVVTIYWLRIEKEYFYWMRSPSQDLWDNLSYEDPGQQIIVGEVDQLNWILQVLGFDPPKAWSFCKSIWYYVGRFLQWVRHKQTEFLPSKLVFKSVNNLERTRPSCCLAWTFQSNEDLPNNSFPPLMMGLLALWRSSKINLLKSVSWIFPLLKTSINLKSLSTLAEVTSSACTLMTSLIK